jgi:hypothetical protein
MRAEGCGIADAAEQEHYKAPTPRSSIPIRGEANSKETSLNYSQRMRPQPNARTVRHLVLLFRTPWMGGAEARRPMLPLV